MPRSGQRGCRPPATSGARVQRPRSSCSPAPASPALPRRSASPAPPRAAGRLESSFSVEAILARPDRRAPAISPLSGSAGAAVGFWTALSRPPAPVLPGACPATWLPAYLSAGLDQPCPQHPVLRLRAAHCCGLQGLGVTGLELAHCLGLWGPRDWAQAQDLQDTERSQKRVRTMFNLEQLEELEKVFAKQHNLVGKKRAQLAAQLNLTENQVRVWFQNRRVKYQKQQRLRLPAASAMAASPDEPSSSSNTTIQKEDAESGVDS
ncbi:homeobox protein notochord [Physeter macrocephalus]|uniref:Homeobox protein notochord n=1 Tax=Physeter macrocephalus TaxID=9755 RepID=A0A2Y9EX74_PHYMC|nr:homeobox protein notochord [Physeter catodon]|eukprot:XP_007109733.1 homeobox protein notochord [Physeter catodon]